MLGSRFVKTSPTLTYQSVLAVLFAITLGTLLVFETLRAGFMAGGL